MTSPLFPHVDAGQIDAFVRTLFRHAEPGGYVQLRAFRDDAEGTWRSEDWPAPQINGDLANIVDAAVRFAGECAAAREVVVFCPPVATLNDARHAAEKDIRNGVALSTDCDRSPAQAWRTLSAVLGPATIVAASGGQWTDPSTGEIQPKLHLHWRLSRPTRAFAEHIKLKEARRTAMALIGGDASGVPLVHPLRWPGSWHRKGSPRLATIIDHNSDIEIDLDVALARLVEERRRGAEANRRPAPSGSEEDHQETAALIRAILRGEDYHGPISRLAMRYLLGGMPDAQVVESLRGIMTAVDPGIRDFKGGALHRDRWLSRYNDIPRAVSSARTKLNEDQSDQAADGFRWIEPAPLLARTLEAAAPFPVNFLPGPVSDFACDVADRMQCPVDFIGIPLIICAATLIGKEFRLAPKALDSWTERPCLWGGNIGTVATMKTPAFNEALASIRRMQHEFHKRHEQEIEQYKVKLSASEYAERGWKEACRKALKAGATEMPKKPEAADPPEPPQLRRLLTSDATQESLVDLMQQNPRGILLFRDELSGHRQLGRACCACANRSG